MASEINYYHEGVDDFNSTYPDANCNFIRIAQWNVRGMNDMKKFDELLLFLDNVKVPIDVFCVGETWLKEENCPLFKIPNYDSVFSCRETSSGGLVMYIKSGFSFNVVKNFKNEGMHFIHIELKVNGIFYDVVGVYRPPSYDFSKFSCDLESLLSTNRSRPLFVIGDVNVPVNLSNNNVVLHYKSLLDSYNCICSNTYVTRPVSKNILDHFVVRKEDLSNVRNDTVYSDVSDHLIVVSSMKTTIPKERIVLTKKNRKQI